MTRLPEELTFARRHLVRALIRLAAVTCLIMAPLPFLMEMGSDILTAPRGVYQDLVVYFRHRIEDQISFLLVMVALGGTLWITQKRLARLIVPRVVPECPECGYELIKLAKPRCPECGLKLPPELVVGKGEAQD